MDVFDMKKESLKEIVMDELREFISFLPIFLAFLMVICATTVVIKVLL